MAIKDDIHYNTTAIDGYQSLFRVIIGARGIGKTYNLKCKALLLPPGQACLWVRRYDMKEIDECRDRFTRDLIAEGDFDADDFKIKGYTLFYKGEEKVYFQPLSLADKIKSTSYPNVTMMVYDEFILKKGRVTYLPDEDQKLLDLYFTVFRDRDKGPCYLLANNISFINPIFLSDGFNVSDFEERFKVFGPVGQDGKFIRDEVTNHPYVVVEKYDNPATKEHMKQTEFGRFISHIQYGQYAIENKSLLDDSSFVMPQHPKDASRKCNIRIGNQYIGMYYCLDTYGRLYQWFDDSYDRNQYTFAPRQNLKDGEIPLVRSDYPLNIITKSKSMYYKSVKVKGLVNDMIATNYFR